MPHDPAPQTPLAKTVDNASQASLPGRIEVRYRTWLRCFPRPVLPWLFLMGILLCLALCLLIFAIVTHRYTTLSGLVILLGPCLTLGRRIRKQTLEIKEHFIYGCLNPAQVVSVDPYLVAVLTNLTRVPNGEFYAIRIMPQPLERTHGKRFQIGDPIPTVALYEGSSRKPYWETFLPIAVNCVTDDARVIEDAIQRINADGDDAWGQLNAYLAQVPTPYRSALFPLRALPPSSYPAETTQENAA